MPACPTLRGICMLLLLSIAGGMPHAQSLAASLGNYETTLKVASVAGISAKSFSGVAFHSETRNLYAVDNDNAVVYELSANGTLLRSITTTGFQDPEGISYQSGDFFFISEEGLANIVRIQLPRTGSGPVAWSSGKALNIGANMSNSGIEGVSYCAAKNTVYAVKEITPPRLYRLTLDATGNPATSFPNDPFNIENKSGDAADILALNDGNFILVNQEGNKLEGYNAQGQLLSSLALGMSKPEGIALDTSSGTLYVVGEPLEFHVLKPKTTANRVAKVDAGEISFSLEKGFGNTPSLRILNSREAFLRLEWTGPQGKWMELWRGRSKPGPHRFALNQGLATGVGFYRLSSDSHQRVIKAVSF